MGFEDRLAAFNRGDFCFVGVYARYELHNWQSGVTATFRSAGLWGIESDSDGTYFQQVFAEERQSLIADLGVAGDRSRKKAGVAALSANPGARIMPIHLPN